MLAVRKRPSATKPSPIIVAAKRLYRLAGGSSLGTKLGGTIVLCMLAGLAVGALVFAHEAQVEGDARSRAQARQSAAETIASVQREIRSTVGAVATTGAAMATLWTHGVRDRHAADVLLRGVVEDDPDRFGVWTVWKPNAFDGHDAAFAGTPGSDASGRYLTYWHQNGMEITLDAVRDYEHADLVRAPLERGVAFTTEPYFIRSNERRIAAISYSEPIIADDKVVGAIGVDIALRPLLDAIASTSTSNGARILLVSHDGMVVIDDKADGELRPLQDAHPELVEEFAAAHRDGQFHADRETAAGPVAVGWAPLANLDGAWLVRVEVPTATLDAASQRRALVGPLAGVVAAIMIAVLLSLRLVVTRPLERIETYVKSLGRELDDSCPGTRRADEIGAIARALSSFRDAETEVLRLRQTEQEREVHYAEARREELQQLANHLAVTVQSVAGLVDATSRKIMKRAEAMTAATVASAARTKDIADASRAADASVGCVDEAATALRQAITRIDTEMAQAHAAATQATERANISGGVTEALSSQASRIGEIVALISSIAQRTNMLALNATIEAARAGEAGRGFAIVAQEVKALATQTSAATGDVGRQIEAIQKTATEAAAALSAIRGHVAKIDTVSGAVATAVREQGAATDLIGRSVEDAVAASRGLSLAIGEVDRAATQAGDAATDMLIDIAQLTDEVVRLDEEVRDVISRIRAA